MRQVTIVSDSLSCLTADFIEQYGIDIIPLNFYSGGKVYRDTVDVTTKEAYEIFLKEPDAFRTSPASPEECFEVFRRASPKAQSIMCVTASVKLTALFDMARLAVERAKMELPRTTVRILDSGMATAAEGLVVLAAARAAAAGNGLEEVAKAAEEMKKKVGVIILLDTMRHVYRSGRIPKIAARAASVLNIRPLLTISTGMVHFVGAVRSRKHGIERLIESMRHRVGGKPVHVAVMHAYAPEEAVRLKELVASEFKCTELWISEFSPLMGYSCGTGTLGLAFYPVE